MANIMVNEACNLRCPYCFAEEFVNKAPKEMTIKDFKKALNFVLSDEDERQVGIIGGEPLLYSEINVAMRMALSDPRTEHVMIYTNAVELDRLAPDILDAVKFRMLVNCNSPEDMGEAAFEKMLNNLRDFQENHFGDDRFRLSVNIYKPDFDYSYIIPIVQEFGFNVIRLSVSVPQGGELNGKTPLQYFHEMKPVALNFVKDMVRCGVITGFDCNFIPICVLTEEEREGLRTVRDVFRDNLPGAFSDMFWQRSIFCEIHNCSPVIDVLPDLRAIRCFGMSEHTKEDIHEFRNITDLRNYYILNVDQPALRKWEDNECAECEDRQYGACSGGCLLFKAKQLYK